MPGVCQRCDKEIILKKYFLIFCRWIFTKLLTTFTLSTLSYPSWFETLYHILMLKEILALFTWLLFRWYNLMKYWFGRMFILRRRWRVWGNPGTNFASPVRPAGAVQHRTDHNRTAVHDRTGQDRTGQDNIAKSMFT